MNEKWNEICFLIRKHKESSEVKFQQEIVNVFEKLGWTRFSGEIEEQRRVAIGSAKTLEPDIIIKNKQRDLFVVELKKPSANSTNRNEMQLFSYMRQLKLEFGILINDRIHVYYEDSDSNVPVEVMNIEFKENDSEGINFLELFTKSTYNKENLKKYGESQLRKYDVVDLMTSEQYREQVLDYIIQDLNKKFDKLTVDLAIKHIELNILEKKSDYSFDFNDNESHLTNCNNNTNLEVEKVKRRVPRWLNKSNINSMILIRAMKYLQSNESLSFKTLQSECADIEKFKGNFNQMAQFGIKNHGKVFQKDGDIVTLWQPVKDFVKESYSMYTQKTE